MGDFTLWNWLTITSLVVNLITMILVIVMLTKKNSIQAEQRASEQVAVSKESKQAKVSGVVFCRNCGNQYDSSQSACPSCHAQR
jgi:predicted Zn-ribbon and HTH transcriptional regulator